MDLDPHLCRSKSGLGSSGASRPEVTKTIRIADPGLSAAFEQALRHPPPFPLEACGEIQRLDVYGARSLKGISHCTGLMHLTLTSCDVESLAGLKCRETLFSLMVHGTPLTSLAKVKGYPWLNTVILDGARVTDLSPILGLSNLEDVEVFGVPVSDGVRAAFIDAMADYLNEDDESPNLKIASAEVCRLNRELAERGLDLCYRSDDEQSGVLRPVGSRHGPFIETYRLISVDELDRALAEGQADEATLLGAPPTPAPPPARAPAPKTTNDDVARSRVEDASLSKTDSAALARFIRRFPKQNFEWSDEATLERIERSVGVQIPERLRVSLGVVAGIAGARYHIDELGDGGPGYTLTGLDELGPLDDDERAFFLERLRLLTLGRNTRFLVVARLAPGDATIYRVPQTAQWSRHFDEQRDVVRVAPSFPQLLGKVTAIEVGGEITRKKGR